MSEEEVSSEQWRQIRGDALSRGGGCSSVLMLGYTSRSHFHFTHTSCLQPISQNPGFDTIALHGGYAPDPSVPLGLGCGAPSGIPVHRSSPFIFKDTDHAARLFKLKELGNIYSRLVSNRNGICSWCLFVRHLWFVTYVIHFCSTCPYISYLDMPDEPDLQRVGITLRTA